MKENKNILEIQEKIEFSLRNPNGRLNTKTLALYIAQLQKAIEELKNRD